MCFWITAAAIVAFWILANLKTSRRDGVLLRVHPFRRIMQFIMQTRGESVVYFDTAVQADELVRYIAAARKHFHVDVTHCLVAAVMKGLEENPAMNRFVMGRRVYQRREAQVTFSMKRRKLDREARMSTVKMTAVPGESLQELCARIEARVGVERSDARTYQDREFDLFLLLPRAVLNLAVRLLRWLDYHNLLPHAFLRDDPLYTSVFVANLGSLGMGAAFHHLYEWGNCPLFLAAGHIEERPVVEDGQVVIRRFLPIRWTYDERIDDGLNARFGIATLQRILEHPFEELGGVPSPEPARQ
ncbi:MAG: 2-oxo acid dehydrogenase subunit E2 [Deltaproteobacteria bacterium]|nr:2-oxo acid dehydrogenase subunit E2 [Deltaproteobacteria bacterium]